MAWSGRLEVNVDGEWGTICDTGFDMNEANVVCRAMGFGSAKSLQIRASYGQGTGKIHYSSLRFVSKDGLWPSTCVHRHSFAVKPDLQVYRY